MKTMRTVTRRTDDEGYEGEGVEVVQNSQRHGIARESFFWRDVGQYGAASWLCEVSLNVKARSLVSVEQRYGSNVFRQYGVKRGTRDTLRLEDPQENISLLVVYYYGVGKMTIEVCLFSDPSFPYLIGG